MNLIPLLVGHERLRRRRSPLWAVRPLRLLCLLTLLYGAFLLMRQGLALPALLHQLHPDEEPLSALSGLLPLWLVTDFWLRFSLQGSSPIPLRSYALLPVPRRTLVHFLLLRTLLSPSVLLWACLLVPFSVAAVLPQSGWGGTLLWWTALWLLVMADGLGCAALSLLLSRRILWVLLPAALHIILLWAYAASPSLAFASKAWTESLLGTDPTALLPPLLLTGAMYALCFALFMRCRLQDGDNWGKRARRASFVPALLRTEWLMRVRCSRLRSALLSALCCMVLLCLTLCASPETPGTLFCAFTSFYCYAVPVTLLLSGLPGHEAHWMDLLLLHRGSILRLFRAKYLFCLALLLPAFVMLLPAVVLGRTPLMESLSQALLTAGVLCPLLFALAPFQRVKLPLHRAAPDALPTTRLKALSAFLLFVPLGLERLCVHLWGEPTAWALLSAAGLAGLALSPLWLRAIASATMQQRYRLSESFRTIEH